MKDSRADWTVMIYMNADANDLEREAFETMAALSELGSSAEVNIVVQLDLGKSQAQDRGRWQHARRFHVRHRMPAHAEYALRGFANNVNMGDGRVLREFVEWAMTDFPAKHTMLIIWGHGQGFGVAGERVLDGDTEGLSPAEISCAFSEFRHQATRFQTALVDHASDNDPLHVRELQEALESHGHRFDIIGFDSCLMAMLEVAHAVRNCGDYMLASEEVLAGSGWSYAWLADLLDDPTLSPERLALRIVRKVKAESEANRMSCVPRRPILTFSALRLGKVHYGAADLDQALRVLREMGAAGKTAVFRARKLCQPFGFRQTTTIRSVDLIHFLDSLCAELEAEPVREALETAKDSISDIILAEHASPDRRDPPYGAQGLAIYFPSDLPSVRNDPYRGCYFGDVPQCPQIEFATAHLWREFLEWLLDLQY